MQRQCLTCVSAALYYSILGALGLVTLLMFCLYMASLAATTPRVQRQVTLPLVLPPESKAPVLLDGSNQAILEALKQSDENLKKRIIALATKVCSQL